MFLAHYSIKACVAEIDMFILREKHAREEREREAKEKRREFSFSMTVNTELEKCVKL